jgi:prepilin-type N-terminal cleavage/methylation domain-containing protein
MKIKLTKKDARAGFSMIEVLVAATILVVIVMMLSMIFQQTSIAWRTGVRRADAFTQVRALIGAVQRDAAKAVDEKCIEETLRSGGKPQNFNGGLRFFTLSGNGFVNNQALRSISYVEYVGGTRSESFLQGDGTWSTPETAQVTDFVEWSGDDTINLENFRIQEVPSGVDGLPLSVRFTVSVTSKGYNLEIGAASAGPDGAWDTKDDIRTWVQ